MTALQPTLKQKQKFTRFRETRLRHSSPTRDSFFVLLPERKVKITLVLKCKDQETKNETPEAAEKNIQFDVIDKIYVMKKAKIIKIHLRIKEHGIRL